MSKAKANLMKRMVSWREFVKEEPHLTFGDLREGETFIAFPSPGDNSGHGGFLKGTYLFRKQSGLQSNCSRVCDNTLCSNPDEMPVIKII